MLSKYERRELKQFSFLKQNEMENQYDVVTTFYPAQRLTLTLREGDVINIMNCDYGRAKDYLNNVRKKLNKDKFSHVRTFDFCAHMNIDEMFIQVFLASLKNEGPLPPVKRKPAPENPAEAIDGPLRTIYEIKDDLQKGIMESFESIQMRADQWQKNNPLGEPMYKIANPLFRIVIRPFEVAQMLEIHIQTAREMFNEARKAYGLPKQRFMSINLFCNAHHIDARDTRRCLAILHDDKKEEFDD